MSRPGCTCGHPAPGEHYTGCVDHPGFVEPNERMRVISSLRSELAAERTRADAEAKDAYDARAIIARLVDAKEAPERLAAERAGLVERLHDLLVQIRAWNPKGPFTQNKLIDQALEEAAATASPAPDARCFFCGDVIDEQHDCTPQEPAPDAREAVKLAYRDLYRAAELEHRLHAVEPECDICVAVETIEKLAPQEPAASPSGEQS